MFDRTLSNPRDAECLKTGAYIHFEDYNAYAPGDLISIGDVIIVQFMPAGWSFEPHRRTTHRVSNPTGYHHAERGIMVVLKSQIVTMVHEEVAS